MKKVFPVAAVVFILSFSLQASFVANASQINIMPPSSNPYGLSYEEHIKNFWTLILSIPADENPWDDPTGEKCASSNERVLKNSSIFYLAHNQGGKTVRTCVVPAEKSLFIPISPMEASDKEAPGNTVDQLRETAKGDQDSLESLSLTMGDKVYEKESLKPYRTPTSEFVVDFANNALFGIDEGGPSKVVADGYYIITEPVPKGNYTIQFTSLVRCPGGECGVADFASDIRYNLRVE